MTAVTHSTGGPSAASPPDLPPLASQPLLLISQIQRSGGSMLAQLFDGHPQVLAHPAELFIGKPQKWHWPELDRHATPKAWFDSLYERGLVKFIGRGFAKAGSNPYALEDVHPYRFSPHRQIMMFLALIEQHKPASQRAILDCYFTSYFAAWEDYRPTGRERYLSAFCPQLLMVPKSLAGYLRDYPDGRVLSSVRDPRTWYVSCHRHSRNAYPDAVSAIRQWRQSTESILSLAEHQPERIMFFTYEAAIRDPVAVIRRAAAWLGIEYLDILTVPTYLGRPVLPNSSFGVSTYGVNTLSLDRAQLLAPADRDYIEREAMPLYLEAERLSGSRVSGPRSS